MVLGGKGDIGEVLPTPSDRRPFTSVGYDWENGQSITPYALSTLL